MLISSLLRFSSHQHETGEMTMTTANRYQISTVHGESKSLFHVIDSHAADDDQPAIVATYHDKTSAERDTTNRKLPGDQLDQSGQYPIIDLSRPIRSERVRAGFQPHWRTIFVYLCGTCHNEVRVFANSFRGSRPEPGRGAISCPHCDFKRQYPDNK